TATRKRSAGWCVGLVGGDGAAGLVLEDWGLALAVGVYVVVVEMFVGAGAEQDEVVQLGLAAEFDGGEVVGFEFARGGAAGVLAVPVGAFVECALLGVGGAASDAGVHEVAALRLDGEAAGVAGEPLGGLRAQGAC